MAQIERLQQRDPWVNEPFWALDPTEWEGREPPPRDWMVEGLFLRGTVALLSGDGGKGKSLLMQQLLTCAALGASWLDLRVAEGGALMLACEDDRDELWRRQRGINRSLGVTMTDVGGSGLRLRSRVGEDNRLMALERSSWSMKRTPLLDKMWTWCVDNGIQYVVLDTASDVFGGQQQDERQVIDFISELRRLAEAIGGLVILTKHPSMSGRSNGSGEGGSVQWNNRVRTRLYLNSGREGLVLKTMKSNYAPSGKEIPLRWERGVFVMDGKPVGGSDYWNE